MHPPIPPQPGRPAVPPLGVWLWGAVELLALARSRWSMRARRRR